MSSLFPVLPLELLVILHRKLKAHKTKPELLNSKKNLFVGGYSRIIKKKEEAIKKNCVN